MHILVTGGAGFIGSHSVAALLADGHTDRVFDNLSSGQAANVPAEAELVIADITDHAAVEAAIRGCAATLHLAALVSVPQSLEQPIETLAVNTTGTAHLLEAARRAGCARVVLASTCAVYGDIPGVKDEQAPLRPLVPYATSKLMAEELMRCYARSYGVQAISLRYFNVYGPRQRADSPYSGVLARWCAAARAGQLCRVFGDGEQTRDFVSVHDVARANLMALTSPAAVSGEVYNVATGRATSLNDILTTLRDLVGPQFSWEHAPARTGDIPHSRGDSARLQDLGWHPQVGLSAGLAELVMIR